MVFTQYVEFLALIFLSGSGLLVIRIGTCNSVQKYHFGPETPDMIQNFAQIQSMQSDLT